jgi:hypothetical protein
MPSQPQPRHPMFDIPRSDSLLYEIGTFWEVMGRRRFKSEVQPSGIFPSVRFAVPRKDSLHLTARKPAYTTRQSLAGETVSGVHSSV